MSADKATNIDHLELMLYVDGELDEDAARDIATRLEGEPGSQLVVQSLEQVHDTVRSCLELAADDVEDRLDAMWSTIERRIHSNGASAPALAAPAPARPAPAGGGLWAAIGRFFSGYRGHFMTGALAAGAAAVLIMAVRPAREVVIERPVAQVNTAPDPGSPQGTTPGPVNLVKDTSRPPEIEQLEVIGGSGTIFVMPSEGGDDVSATVIFVDLNDVEGPL